MFFFLVGVLCKGILRVIDLDKLLIYFYILWKKGYGDDDDDGRG